MSQIARNTCVPALLALAGCGGGSSDSGPTVMITSGNAAAVASEVLAAGEVAALMAETFQSVWGMGVSLHLQSTTGPVQVPCSLGGAAMVTVISDSAVPGRLETGDGISAALADCIHVYAGSGTVDIRARAIKWEPAGDMGEILLEVSSHDMQWSGDGVSATASSEALLRFVSGPDGSEKALTGDRMDLTRGARTWRLSGYSIDAVLDGFTIPGLQIVQLGYEWSGLLTVDGGSVQVSGAVGLLDEPLDVLITGAQGATIHIQSNDSTGTALHVDHTGDGTVDAVIPVRMEELLGGACCPSVVTL